MVNLDPNSLHDVSNSIPDEVIEWLRDFSGKIILGLIAGLFYILSWIGGKAWDSFVSMQNDIKALHDIAIKNQARLDAQNGNTDKTDTQ